MEYINGDESDMDILKFLMQNLNIYLVFMTILVATGIPSIKKLYIPLWEYTGLHVTEYVTPIVASLYLSDSSVLVGYL